MSPAGPRRHQAFERLDGISAISLSGEQEEFEFLLGQADLTLQHLQIAGPNRPQPRRHTWTRAEGQLPLLAAWPGPLAVPHVSPTYRHVMLGS